MAKQPKIPAAYIALMREKPPAYNFEAWRMGLARLAGDMLAGFEPALCEAFNAANGKATVHTLTAAHAISIARQTESRLETLGIPRKHRAGTILRVTGGGPSASAYKYPVATTHFALKRNAIGDWTLTDCRRTEVWPGVMGVHTLFVSPEARDAIVKRALEGIAVHP